MSAEIIEKNEGECTSSSPDSISDNMIVVLFYKYFPPSIAFVLCQNDSNKNNKSSKQRNNDGNADATGAQSHEEEGQPTAALIVEEFLKPLCERLEMKGRLLVASEGINGSLSAKNQKLMDEFVCKMESFHWDNCMKKENYSNSTTTTTINKNERGQHLGEGGYLFRDIDWKFSSDTNSTATKNNKELFPDLKISIVSEIVSTGKSIQTEDIVAFGGTHLSPEEFHSVLQDGWENDDNDDTTTTSATSTLLSKDEKRKRKRKELVVIDVRNTFEYAIGHFAAPHHYSTKTTKTNTNTENEQTTITTPSSSQNVAINPEMVAFSSFNDSFCAKYAQDLKNKKVLLYCTGGIRCEKASAMLRKHHDVQDVSQLSGGIHRYLERYGNAGFFKGKNFVFDKRVALDESDFQNQVIENDTMKIQSGKKKKNVVVGSCLECKTPFDEISGSRLCTICRDLVLICPTCQEKLREYHCQRHSNLKHCYFTFLEVFDKIQLEAQLEALEDLCNGAEKKNVRNTLKKQIEKVKKRIDALKRLEVTVDKAAPRRCRSCFKSECNGLCWGFWKRALTE